MPAANVEYTVDPGRAAEMRATIAKEILERKGRVMRRRILLAVLGLIAVVLRMGMQTKVLPIDNPGDDTTFTKPPDELTWYEHPVALFFLCGLIAPIPLLSIVASELREDRMPFLLKLSSNYYDYIRGMFITSILVDLLQALFHVGPPASLFSALFCYFERNVWIDPFTRTDQLSLPSYQATVTAYAACFCLMMVNKSFNSRFAHSALPRIVLRAVLIGSVAPVVAALSFGCYEDYLTSHSPAYVEFYYVSVVMGMVTAIFEVQGTTGYDPAPNEYFVIMSRYKNGHKGINLGPRMPMDKDDYNGEKVKYIGAQCYRHYQIIKKQHAALDILDEKEPLET